MNDDILRREGSQSLLRERGALESAVMRPQTAAHYEQADLVTQAALLIAPAMSASASHAHTARLYYHQGVVQGLPADCGQLAQDDAFARAGRQSIGRLDYHDASVWRWVDAA
jgi:hypothetical protein